MSDRRPSQLTESIAEAMRAGVALVAVVLLARSNAGGLTRSPSVWVGLPACLFVWGAAALGARWSVLTEKTRLSVWRDCVAPALITLVIAGRGGSSSLAIAMGLVVIGSVAVGWVAARQPVTLDEPERVVPESKASPAIEPITADSVAPTNETSGRNADEVAPLFENPSRIPPPHIDLNDIPGIAPPPAETAEIISSPGDEFSPAESWTRMESDGDVSIEAVVHARFAEGSKLAVVHLPFIPPLPDIPQIECEPLDSGCELTIQIEAAFRHGARLSVSRMSAGPAELVPIGVVIYTSADEEVEL